MSDYYWDNKLEYLKTSRTTMWNDDYLEFLVEKVWKIKSSVNIIDFGCGLGFLGAMLLPILPKGSTYTGIDKGESLINEAISIFKDSPYETNFIQKDLLEYEPTKQYDIAICQTVLQHIPNAKSIVSKMKDSIVDGGKVICVELDSVVANAAIYFDGLNYNQLHTLGNLQKIVEHDSLNGQSDKSGGLKVPVIMQQLGLKDIDIRVNDHVQFINPKGNKNKKDIKSYLSSPLASKQGDKETIISSLISKGLTQKEAEHQYNSQVAISDYINDSITTSSIVNSLCLFISYGTK